MPYGILEPATLALVAVALLGMATRRWRYRAMRQVLIRLGR